MAPSELKLSIVIPALNEADRIGDSLEELAAWLEDEAWLNSTEVIVVAATGKDQTAAEAKRHAGAFHHFKVVEPGPPVGKGRDVKVGMEAASGQYRLFMDADLATPLPHLKEAMTALEGGADLVYGARDLWQMHEALSRKIISVAGNLLIQVVALPGIGDSQCGFKGFNWTTAAVCFDKQTLTGWGFDFELFKIARVHKLKLHAVAINDWHDPKLGAGLVGESNTVAMSRTLKELLKVRWQAWRGAYR